MFFFRLIQGGLIRSRRRKYWQFLLLILVRLLFCGNCFAFGILLVYKTALLDEGNKMRRNRGAMNVKSSCSSRGPRRKEKTKKVSSRFGALREKTRGRKILRFYLSWNAPRTLSLRKYIGSHNSRKHAESCCHCSPESNRVFSSLLDSWMRRVEEEAPAVADFHLPTSALISCIETVLPSPSRTQMQS